MKREKIIKAIKSELIWTDTNTAQFHSTHEGYGVLLEEVDELWDKIKTSKEYTKANKSMTNEAVQVAAMAIKFIENLYP